MEKLYEVRSISVSIRRSVRDVYAYASNPENLPRWASGLTDAIRREGDVWIAEGGGVGNVRVRFTPPNDLGVLDHDVELPNGYVAHNPVRVVPNGEGSTVTFTLFRVPGMNDDTFDEDAATVEKDLGTLKGLLEG